MCSGAVQSAMPSSPGELNVRIGLQHIDSDHDARVGFALFEVAEGIATVGLQEQRLGDPGVQAAWSAIAEHACTWRMIRRGYSVLITTDWLSTLQCVAVGTLTPSPPSLVAC